MRGGDEMNQTELLLEGLTRGPITPMEALAELNILQERQPPQVEYAYNYYDLIAAANDKLGQRDAARAAREEFERRDKIRKERVAKLFGNLLDSKEETK